MWGSPVKEGHSPQSSHLPGITSGVEVLMSKTNGIKASTSGIKGIEACSSFSSLKSLLFHKQKELESVRAELDHERSLRLFEKKLTEQTVSMLQRKVALATEEAQKNKELLEMQQEESARIIHQLQQSQTQTLHQFRELQNELELINGYSKHNGRQSNKKDHDEEDVCSDDETVLHKNHCVRREVKVENSSNLSKFSGTDQDILKQCLENLKPSNLSKAPTFDSDADTSKYSKNLMKTLAFLKATVKWKKTGITKNSKSGALYVCGSSGTGKTCGVNFCCKTVQRMYKAEENLKAKICVINASHMIDSSHPLHYFLGEIGQTLDTKTANLLTLDTLKANLKRKFVFLVIDGMEVFLSEKIDGPPSHVEIVLGEILRLANDQEVLLAMIGISNSIDSDKTLRARQFGTFQDVVTFAPYSEDELFKILDARVDTNVFSTTSLRLIARKVAQSSGDARRALETASNFVNFCLKNKA